MFEDFDDESMMDEEFEEDFPAEGADNRTFMIAIGVIGGLTVLALICIGAYMFFISPRSSDQRLTEVAAAYEQQTQVAMFARQTQEAQAATPTRTVTPSPTVTPTSTRTQVVAQATNTSVLPTDDPRTATVAALLTQAAGSTSVATSTAFPTALPDTGFADDVGIPGLIGLAFLSIVVIFLVRRLRLAGS